MTTLEGLLNDLCVVVLCRSKRHKPLTSKTISVRLFFHAVTLMIKRCARALKRWGFTTTAPLDRRVVPTIMLTICPLGCVLLCRVESIMLGQRQLCSAAWPESSVPAFHSQVSQYPGRSAVIVGPRVVPRRFPAVREFGGPFPSRAG